MNDKRIETLFTRFTAIYGQLWLVAYQNEQVIGFAKREWAESLNEFNNQILKLALERTKKTNLFPPTLPVFVACCSTIQKEVETRNQSNTFKAEPHKKASLEVVRLNIKKMKDHLNQKPEEKNKC